MQTEILRNGLRFANAKHLQSGPSIRKNSGFVVLVLQFQNFSDS